MSSERETLLPTGIRKADLSGKLNGWRQNGWSSHANPQRPGDHSDICSEY